VRGVNAERVSGEGGMESGRESAREGVRKGEGGREGVSESVREGGKKGHLNVRNRQQALSLSLSVGGRCL
jgi:hypothetical protein